jgi:hypothetical protein
MRDDIEQISYGHSGYQTVEDEAEARLEERERYRRRFLCCIRGRLREGKGGRWWIAFLIVGCAGLAWFLAGIPATARFGGVWHPGLAVLATWPVYVIALFLRAKAEGHRLELAGHWDSLMTRDERGELEDRAVSEQIDRVVNNVWSSNRSQNSQNSNPLAEFVLMTVVTVGTWLIWDLLRMGPELMAEIILDGVLVPTYPEIEGRMPSEAWYKTAFASTGLHFTAAALCTVVVVAAWTYIHMAH